MILTEVNSFAVPKALFQFGDSVDWQHKIKNKLIEQSGVITGLHLNIYQDDIYWEYTIRITQFKLAGEILLDRNSDEEIISERELTAHW